MNYDRYAIGLLIAAPDAPELDEQAAAALQDAHMSHLADLHETGGSWLQVRCSTRSIEGFRS
jgi:hypothetical protein